MKQKVKFPPLRGIIAAPMSAPAELFDILIAASEGPASPFERIGDCAVVDICGPVTQHSFSPFSSYDEIREHAAMAFESDCQTVVLRIDSPGGDFAGSLELSEDLRRMSRAANKKLIAFTDSMALSAAYAIGCAADEFCITP